MSLYTFWFHLSRPMWDGHVSYQTHPGNATASEVNVCYYGAYGAKFKCWAGNVNIILVKYSLKICVQKVLCSIFQLCSFQYQHPKFL